MANPQVVSKGKQPPALAMRRNPHGRFAEGMAASGDAAALSDGVGRQLGRSAPDFAMGKPAGDPELTKFIPPGTVGEPVSKVAATTMSLAAIIGESAPMQALRRRARQLLDVERRGGERGLPPVLISGETGTGKKLLARALHFEGVRRDAPFVKVDCASLTLQRFEAEMFGHAAPRSARGGERRIGLVEAAEGGTLLLDEIDELDLPGQARLLKLIEEQMFRDGDGRERRVDIRIMSTTDHDLGQLVRQGRFRGDLYFRLCVVTLAMPPLRSMGNDVLRIAAHCLQGHSIRYGRSSLNFSAAAKARLLAHAWPGNVRELRNKLEQAVLLAQGELIEPEQLDIAGAHPEPETAASPRPDSVAAEAAHSAESDHDERETLRRALDQTAWNVSRSARLLRLSRDTIRYRIKKFGFVRPLD